MGRAWNCLLPVLTLVLRVIEGFAPDEMECPDTLHTGIESPEYWVPFNTPFRAWRTLPWRYFEIKPSTIPQAGMGVFATSFIPGNTWLGEYEGEIISADLVSHTNLLVYAWNSYNDDVVTHYIEGVDPDRSNWMRFINSPNHWRAENTDNHYCFGRVFYRTIVDIYPGQELFICYGEYYSKQLGIFDTYFDD